MDTLLTDTKRRILDRLKRVDSLTVPVLATAFGLTETAVRQHLDSLEVAGLVERALTAPSGRGRPPISWRLTTLGAATFPDRHGDLTTELIGALRSSLGDDALEQVLEQRATKQRDQYRESISPSDTIAVRVITLAKCRMGEGYLAEAVETDGGFTLIEHHCPIASAARECNGLCRTELDVFRAVLGDDVVVERTAHLLNGDKRCAYSVTPRKKTRVKRAANR